MKSLYFIMFITFIAPYCAFSEGTKELMPDETNPTRILLSNATGRDPFALESGAPDYRLLIH